MTDRSRSQRAVPVLGVEPNPQTWGEPAAEASIRESFSRTTPPALLRAHYPLSGRVANLSTRVYSKKPGDRLTYLRVRKSPELYPLEALVFTESGSWREYYQSEEVEVERGRE